MNNLDNQGQQYTCLVVEEKNALGHLPQLLKSLSTSMTFRICTDYQQATGILANESISLILLSFFPVKPNELDALSFFYRIRASYPILMMVNQLDTVSQYSFEEENVLDCLLKPVQLPRLQLAFHKFFRRQLVGARLTKKDWIFLKLGRCLRRFNLDEMMYIQAMGTYSTIVTPQGEFMVNETISTLEQKLPTDRFFRVHKSYLIGVDHLVGFENNKVLVQHIKLPIGKTYIKKLEPIFELYDQ